MQALLTPDEFVRRAVGIPWRKWCSDWSACDCFGLIALYHREVLGLELGEVPHTDIASGFDSAAAAWVECDATAGAFCFMAWRSGAPTHCGIVLPGASLVLHSEGSEAHHGGVRVSRASAIARIYGDLKYYRHAQC